MTGIMASEDCVETESSVDASWGSASDWTEVQVEVPWWEEDGGAKVSKICMIMYREVAELEFWLHHEGDVVAAQISRQEYSERQVPYTPMYLPDILLLSEHLGGLQALHKARGKGPAPPRPIQVSIRVGGRLHSVTVGGKETFGRTFSGNGGCLF